MWRSWGEGPAITLEDLGNVGEFVGAIAVVASLVYLAVQIRQNSRQIEMNTRAAGSAAYAQTQTQLAAWTRWVATSGVGELMDRWSREPGEISPEERDQLRRAVGDFLYAMEDLFHLWEQGLVDTDTWENQFLNSLGLLSRPGILALVAGRSGPISRRFHHHLEQHLEDQPGT